MIRKFLNRYWGWTFLFVPLVLQVIFFYFPMFQGAFYSFTNWTGLTYQFDFVGFNNYKLLMIDGKFMKAILFTLVCLILRLRVRPFLELGSFSQRFCLV